MTSDPRKYVALWLKNKGIAVNARGLLQSPDGRESHQIFNTLYLDYCEQVAAYNETAARRIQGARESNMLKALEEYQCIEGLRKRDEVFKPLLFSGTENLAPLKTFVQAVTGTENLTTVNVLAHFLWMIKRKYLNKPVVDHIMPIFYGKQRAGKSETVKKLIGPLFEVTLDAKVNEITDSRHANSLSQNFVAFFDEMSGSKKTEVEGLKRQISALYNDYRKLNTNMVSKVKQNCSFMGTTNIAVNQLIYDPTGARRFYEIRTLDVMDWETLNKLDFIALYQGINENLETGYLQPIYESVQKEQEHLIGIDEITMFIETYKVASGTREVSASQVYQVYSNWAESNGIKNPLNAIWFGRRLSDRKIQDVKKTIRGKTARFYLVADDCALLKEGYDPLASDLNKWN